MAKRTRLLVVDDDPDILFTMKQILSYAFEGADVATAPNGQDALRIIRDNGLAGLVTDYRMPGLNGVELAEAARRESPGLPVILVTAFQDEAIDRDAKSAGIDAIIRKPFDVDTLVAKVAASLAS